MPPAAEPLPDPELAQLRAFADDRRRLLADIADARAEIARYRQIVVDIERNAPPPLLDAPGTPDDLKLIVGVGPVIERMLYQLGIRPTGKSRGGANATSTSSTRGCGSFPGAFAVTVG